MESTLENDILTLSNLNPGFKKNREITSIPRIGNLKKVLIANRGEIAKRFFLSLREEGIPSVAVVTDSDLGQSWYEFADEFIRIGDISNYTNIELIVAAAILSKANAIYPGYGFLSENPNFVKYIKKISKETNQEIIFMGPDDSVMDRVGEKLSARKLAKEHGVPLFEGSEAIDDIESAKRVSSKIGYPVIVKLSNGGGGKGMMPVFKESGLFFAIESAKRIGKTLYNDDTFYIEKYITKPVHIEVQIFNGTAIGIRKCAVQRRNQKVIEETGDFFIDDFTTLSLLAAAENMAKISGYGNNCGAGTVEFLYDQDSERIGFLEMNTRLQVEHPVTDQSLGIDLAKWQVLLFDGRENEIDYKSVLEKRFIPKDHSIECRIYAEDPESGYTPSPGYIEDLELPTFNGVRCDFGFRKGDRILPDYDPMIGKIISRGSSRKIAIARMERGLSELYIKGLTTNINQLLHILRDEDFINGGYTNRLLEDKKTLEKINEKEIDAVPASVFSALCEYGKYTKLKSIQSFNKKDMEISESELEFMKLPTEFQVETENFINTIRLLQTSVDSFQVLYNNIHLGEAQIESKSDSYDDYLIRFGLRSYSIRIDNRPGYSVIRMKNTKGKIVYIRLKIFAKGLGKKLDEPGLIRAPFQGSFVKFGRDENAKRDRLSIGSIVKKGDPIVIISAMKMETVISSPTNGTIKFLVEDGDLAKLQVGTTPQGQIIGKNIPEGEILFIVEPNDELSTNIHIQTKQISSFNLTEPVSNISVGLENLIKNSDIQPGTIPEEFLLEMIKSYTLGFSIDENIIQKAIQLLNVEHAVKSKNSKFLEFEINKILTIYYLLRQLYAPSIGKNISIFNELNEYLNNWNQESFTPSLTFKYTMDNLFKFYSVNKWLGVQEDGLIQVEVALFYIQRAYHNLNSEILNTLLRYIENTEKDKVSKKTINILKKIYSFEEAERDDENAESIRKILVSLNQTQNKSDNKKPIPRKYLNEFKVFLKSPEQFFTQSMKISDWDNKIRNSIQSKNPYTTSNNQSHFFLQVSSKLERIQKDFAVFEYYSPIGDLLIFGLESIQDSEDKRYILFYDICKMDDERDTNGKIIGSPNSERATIESAILLKNYQNVEERKNNQIEIIANQEETIVDLGSLKSDVFNFQNLFQVNINVNHFLKDLNVKRLIGNINCKSPLDGSLSYKMFELKVVNGNVVPDLIVPEDPRNIYYDKGASQATLRLFEKDKWPIEFWVNECFQNSSINEIHIPEIDAIVWNNPKTGNEEIKPVGGKIYLGMLGDSHCLFYMKDSRINGGATGDLEGLKYLAVLFLSYRWNIPVYIWNDGAGANIKEGMVSLNRAGQGFMMNSLLSSSRDEAKFNKFTLENPDHRVRELFQSIDTNLRNQYPNIIPSRTVTIAVGVGSSTGLDVYGSSQTAIQIMLDSEESYRVLTGSNVIKSVMGEDFTNYQIGGAPVMSKWTGTVDIVAKNKLHLLPILRSVQYLFTKAIESSNKRKSSTIKKLATGEIINEQTIRDNLDNGFFLPFKEEYFGSGSLIGGFGKLSGSGVCILATRNNYGIRSFATVTRAKELSIIAKKLNFDKILIFGENWFFLNLKKDAQTIQARKDFLNQYGLGSGMNIHIVLDISGLERAPIHSLSHIIIFVHKNELSIEEQDFVSKSSTLQVEDIDKAFEIAGRILNYKNEKFKPDTNILPTIPKELPELPNELGQPFDIMEKIILRTFDEGSFIEFFASMNDPMNGPSLITGLAKINGITVGVIADQPMIMGGAPDAPGTEKFRIFTNFLNRFHLPIVMLSNAPGFLPGTKQERLRIQQIGGESLDSNILGEVPVVSIVLNQNYGGRLIHAFSKAIRPGIVYMALKQSIMSVMGGSASFDLFMGSKYNSLLSEGKKDEAVALKDQYINDFNTKSSASNDAFATGVLDELIPDVRDLRSFIIRGLDEAMKRAEYYFHWK